MASIDAIPIDDATPGHGDVPSRQDIRDVLAFITARWPEQGREYRRMVTGNDN